MEFLDQRIAMLEREQRRQENKVTVDKLTMDEIVEGLHKGILRFPQKKELHFQTNTLFPEQIPMVIISDFYPDKQETEDMVIYVNNDEQVSQALVHLPKEMDDLTVEEWVNQVKNGIKEKGMYAEIKKVKSLPYMDYLIYRSPSKKGWIYNLAYRIQKENRRIVGAYNCMEKDMETYGQLLEAMILETQQQL